MAFEDDFDPDWLHDLPFYIVAVMAHGSLLVFNPTLRWGSAQKALEQIVPIEFVAQLPPPSVNLAPAPGVPGKTDRPPRHGPGEYKPEKVKAGAVAPPPKPLPSPKPAAVKSHREKIGNTVSKVKHPAKPRPATKTVAKPAAKPAKTAADIQAEAFAMAAKSETRRVKLERERAAREQAKALAAEKAAEARAAAEERAEAARQEKARRAKEKARLAEEKAQREAEAREAARQAQIRAQEARAAKARKKAELSQELSTMADPDEALDAGAPPPPPISRASKGGGKGGAKGADDGGLRATARSAAAAALAETAESKDPGDAAGSGGADLLDAKPRGGGTGPEGGGVSWSLDGPVGSRRVLRRAVPTSPDWVGTRGLDLTVTVRFQVLPDGSVKPGAVILKTSGFPEIDRRGLDALRQWRFEAAPSTGGAEVWGRVTFRFTS